jgi:hypothetical protein
MKATLLLSTLVIGLISVTPSFAQSVSGYSRNFGYPSYAGAPYQPPVFGSPRLWGSKRPHKEPHAIPAWAPSRLTRGPVPNAADVSSQPSLLPDRLGA